MISKRCFITNARSHAVYDVPVYLPCGVPTLSRRSKTRGACSKLKRPEYQMFEVVIDESSALLTTGWALMQLVVVKRNIVLSTDAKIVRISATAACP